MMTTEAQIKQKGMEALLQNLGDVDAERFLSLLLKEPFDYTQWQDDLWKGQDVGTISEQAQAHRQSQNNK